MPVKSDQELQTLNVQNLNAKTNLYGNLVIPPLNGKPGSQPVLQKAKSLESGVELRESNGNDSPYVSIQSIDSLNNNKNKELHLKRGNDNKGVINRYDSGYGSYVDFHSETSFQTESINSVILLEEPDHLNEIESINANNRFVISEWQTYTSDGVSPLVIPSMDTPFPKTITPFHDSNISAKIPETILENVPQNRKRNEYIRKVERFGTDLKDTCLFPLALPMDGSDVFKGKSDWQSITLLADCVLTKWIECSEKSIKRVNKVLPNASKYLCPNPELQTRIIQYPSAKLPLRRTNSELDFYKLGLAERKGVIEQNIIKQLNSNVGLAVRDDFDINVSNEKGRMRAHTSLSIRRKSVTFQLPKRRKDRFDLRIGGNLKTDAKILVQSIRLENPISLALQITKIEKDLMTGLPSDEVMALVLKKGKAADKTSHMNKLFEFGHELSQLIADIILREATVEAQGKKIAAIIEVGCVLRKLRNWQSLTSLIRGLQLPKIYCLSNAWTVTRTKYPIHFNDYLKLSRVVSNDSIAILRSREPSIPSITSFLSLLRVRCLATWDRLERAPRWTESPNLVFWLEGQMLNSIAVEESVTKSEERMAELIAKKNKKKKQIVAIVKEFHEKSETHLEKCIKQLSPERQSFLPLNDPIYFIEDDHLPMTWTIRSARNIPAQHQSKIVRCFKNSYKIELSHIEKYNMNS